MTDHTQPPFGSAAFGDEPLRVLEGGLMAAQGRGFDDPAALAEIEREQQADLHRLASELDETEELLDRLEAEGLRIGFELKSRGVGVTVRDARGYTVRELRPSDVTNLARLRELVHMP